MKGKPIVVVLLITLVMVFMLFGCGEHDGTAASVRLNIPTYLGGQNQPTHPSLHAFDIPWNGYKYWMAYTPFPDANGEEENPSIAVSNDLISWESPLGLANPVAYNEELGCNELKDCHIVYRDDVDRIELWYLGRLSPRLGGDGSTLGLFRKYSQNGTYWSRPEFMGTCWGVSPSIIWDGSNYHMWYITSDENGDGGLYYKTSMTGYGWTDKAQCTIDGEGEKLKIWHGTVIKNENAFELVYVDDSEKSDEILYCTSADGLNFSAHETVATKGAHWRNLYRPYLLYAEGQAWLYYGVVTSLNEWYITLSHGEDVFNLNGITQNDAAEMTKLTDTPIYDNEMKSYALRLRMWFAENIRGELFVIAPALLILSAVRYKKTSAIKRRAFVLCTGVILSTFLVVMFNDGKSVFWVLSIGAIHGIAIGCICDFIVDAIRDMKEEKK